MRILFTNTTLAHRTGSELYVLDVARALVARGHTALAWSPVVGALGAELAAAGVPVVDHLEAVGEPPDLIHGHHHLETLTALLHFPGVPALFVCHGAKPWEESPPRFPRILRYVAVDAPTRERLLGVAGLDPRRIATVPTFVDLERFRPRPPLPPKPRRALVFGNNARPDGYVTEVRAACARSGIALDVVGIAAGQVEARPELLLPEYDLVFAKARAAFEAMAVGAAVVLCDAAGCGPLVTTAGIDRLRPLNFGFATLTEPVTAAALAREIERYDPDDAARVSRQIRETAGLEGAVDRYLEIYSEIVDEGGRTAGDPDAELRAASTYLAWLDPALKERARLLIDRDELWRRLDAGTAERTAREGQALALGAEIAGVREELAALRATATWRLRERLVRSPLLRALWRRLRGPGPAHRPH